MKLNNLLLSLALVATGSVMVACGSGSSGGGNPNPAPVPTPLTPPIPVPAGSTSGIAIQGNTLAIPGSSGYSTVTLSPVTAAAVISLVNAPGGATFQSSPNGDVMVIPNNLAAGSQVIIIATGKSTQSSLNADAVANSYTMKFTPTTNLVPFNGTVNDVSVPAGLAYGSSESINVVAPNGGNTVSFASTACAGTPNTISVSNNHGVDYIAFGTTTSGVCVAASNTLQVTNLSNEAPASSQANGYKGGTVTALGFPYAVNQNNSLTGYWTVSNQIYKVLGTITNNTPTGSGFLNTTSTTAQQANGSAQTTSFTNVPANIYSTYVDNSGNVWVGTSNAQVYVLRNGQTAWTNTTPTGASGAVTVSTNYTSSGAIAVIGGVTYSVK